MPKREHCQQLLDLRGVLIEVLRVRLQEYNAASIPVAEQLKRGIRLVFQIAERDDVAVGLHGVEDAVGSRVGLDEPVGPQVFVDEQRVQRRGIETGQEHVHDDHQIEFTVLQPLRQILVVVAELVGAGVVAGAEHLVVVTDRTFEERARIGRQRVGVECFVVEDAVVAGIIRPVREDDADLQALVGCEVLLAQLELCVVPARRID